MKIDCSDSDTPGPTSIIASTPTGANKSAVNINFGRDGLVGHRQKNLILQFRFDTTVKFTGTKTDYDKHPYTIRIGEKFDKFVTTASGSHTFERKILSQMFQVEWEETDETEGIHFEFVGCEKSLNMPGWFINSIY